MLKWFRARASTWATVVLWSFTTVGALSTAHELGWATSSPPNSSESISPGAHHWLIQAVIDVVPDGASGKMRHRLLHIEAAPESRGFSNGMYPNNAAKLEEGIWKLDVMAPDQPYFSSPSFEDGWARKASSVVPRPVVKNAIEPLRNFPPTFRAQLYAAPPSWFAARRHHRVAGHHV